MHRVACVFARVAGRTNLGRSWKDLLATHLNVLAGCDFFLVEVLSWRGLVTYYVLFFLQLACRMNIFAKRDSEGPEVLAIAA